MGSRGQSSKKQLAQLDRASEKYNSLQERADSISNIGGRFYDNRTGQEVSREDVEKLDRDLRESRERFEDLRDRVIERESRAAQRAAERAAKRQATRDRHAGNIPAGIRVTFPDGRTQVYAQGPNDRVMDERGLPRDVQGIRYSDLYNRMVSNQANSGVTFERITGEELSAMQAAHREERANRPDYEFGIGTPWGNSENRRAARVSRRIGRGQRR